jgi:hypothetical protein
VNIFLKFVVDIMLLYGIYIFKIGLLHDIGSIRNRFVFLVLIALMLFYSIFVLCLWFLCVP